MTIPGRYLSTRYGIKLRGLSGFGCVIAFCTFTAIASPAQTLNTLVSFVGTNGARPQSSLVQGVDGNLYGTTILGGNLNCVSGCGTVFKVASQGTLTPLYIFCTQANCPDGNSPAAGLVLGSDGNFYGTTSGDDPFDSGNGSFGTVFKISPSGSLTTLHDFETGCGISCPNGATPAAGLVQGSDGNFYGTTEYQGIINCIEGCGTIFKITPSGSLTTLHSFSGADGGHPAAGLVQGTDGNFYGTTSSGGSSANCTGGCGTVFKMSPNGSLSWIYSFKSTGDGAAPVAGLVQASDGNFYGTTSGGLFAMGTVFKITPSGSLTTLHSFGGTDGSHPFAALVRGSDGSFYGTTAAGGTVNTCDGGCGTIFKITSSGSLTTLHNFSRTDGWYPSAALVQATDGNFYSTTAAGGANNNCDGGCGTVFRLFVGGSMTTVTSAPNPSTLGQSVSITATVGPSGPPTPTGTVGFTSKGTGIPGCASVPLSFGAAICTTATLAKGTDAIVATYSGDSVYSPSSGMVTQIVNPIPVAWQFVPLSPCRIVDTRNPAGTFGGPAIPANTARAFPLGQNGNPCNIPATATAYSLNVTVVPITTLAYLTIWPTGEGQPTVSTLNSLDGRIKASAVIIPAGTANGSVSTFVTNTTNVVLDVNGYFVPSSGSTLAFYPLTPCRVVDTRNANGDLGGPYLQGGQERAFPLLEGNCNLPNTAAAYSLNFTVVPKTSAGVAYLTVWPQGQTKPVVSTLNDVTDTIVANAAIVPAGTGGGVATYPSNDTDLVIDVNGYFAPPGSGGLSFYALTPCRVIDTRKTGNGQPFTGELTVNVETSPCGPPATSAGYVFNATVVPSGPLGYLTLWPDSENKPVVSTLNALDGAVTSNMAIVPNINGETDAYTSGFTQLILDISGYFAP